MSAQPFEKQPWCLKNIKNYFSPSASKDLQILFRFCNQILWIFQEISYLRSKRDSESRTIPLIRHLDGSPSLCPLEWVWPLLCSHGQLRPWEACGQRVTAPEVLPKVFLSRHLLVSSSAFTPRPAACRKWFSTIHVLLRRRHHRAPSLLFLLLFPGLWRTTRTWCGWHLAE